MLARMGLRFSRRIRMVPEIIALMNNENVRRVIDETR
jgi:hypothetical protein